jgi:hypothetical protein
MPCIELFSRYSAKVPLDILPSIKHLQARDINFTEINEALRIALDVINPLISI